MNPKSQETSFSMNGYQLKNPIKNETLKPENSGEKMRKLAVLISTIVCSVGTTVALLMPLIKGIHETVTNEQVYYGSIAMTLLLVLGWFLTICLYLEENENSESGKFARD